MSSEGGNRDHDPDRTEFHSSEAPVTSAADRQIGPYRLLQKIGEGGMGEVWLAEQQQPVRRRVALKVIKHGMDTDRVVARFEAERQALAMMDHPAVAKVFDAGSTPRGRPYFVMEHVKGIPITEHCDRHKLSNRERLELFVQVCEGVQHAHQKAILHRDLKPSNVLVGIQNGRAVPKIIDFGVAKATAQRLTERTMFTELGALLGTPEYMSPEQAESTGQDVDTRTDVYSLGVMLYELLVGALPFDPRELRSGGFEGIVRTIRDAEPSRPSARLSTLGDRSVESAQLRKTDRSTLQRQLEGDLDWITMKALEKDRTRRYGSPADLAADVERYLQDEPVLASPPSIAYRAGKFIRRHRLAVTAAAVIGVVLVSAVVVSTTFGLREAAQRRAAEQARNDLEAVAEFQAKMLAEVDPADTGRHVVVALRDGITDTLRRTGASESEIAAALSSFDGGARNANATDVARRVLDASILLPAAKAIESDFGDRPLIEARLRKTLARTYRTLGMYDEAEPHALRAVELHERELGDGDRLTLDSWNNLASTHWQQGRYDEAEALFSRTLQTQRRALGEDHPDTLRTAYDLAGVHYVQARYDEAERGFVDTLARQRRVLGEQHVDTLITMNGLAATYLSQQRYDEAEPLYVDGLALRRRVLGNEHSDTLATVNNLAVLYTRLGRYDDAEALYREALETNRRVRGESHPTTLLNMSSLSTLYNEQGRYDEAERLLRFAVETARRDLGANHPRTLRATNNLGVTLIESGQHDAARRLLEDLLERDAQVFAPDDPEYALHLHTYGELLMEVGDLDGAMRSLRRVLEIYEVRGSQYFGLVLYQLATTAARRGDRSEAVAFLRRAVDAGYARRSMLDDPHLTTLRGDPEFEVVMAEVSERLREG